MFSFPTPLEIVMMLPGVLMGFTFHEFGHAIVATWFGDDTPRLQGRVTLDPRAHLDIMGTLLLLFAGFGWAKPVQVNPDRIRPRVLGDIAVSLAGVAMNLILAVLFYATYIILNEYVGYQNPVVDQMLWTTTYINVLLIAFNLLPLPPLDGFHVVRHLLPGSMDGLVFTALRFGPWLLILFFMSGLGERILLPVLETILLAVVTAVKFVLL